MSKIGFRRELLGFNREDVIEYIRKYRKENSEREKELLENIETLNRRNSDLIDKLQLIPQLKAKLEISEATIEKLAKETIDIDRKKAEAEKLSQDIAKMYMIAKSNAESVKSSAKESSDLAFYQIKRTLSALETTHSNLEALKERIAQTSENYSRELSDICRSFEAAKSTVADISEQADKAIENISITK